MRVVVTGGRYYGNIRRVYEVLNSLGITELAHGDCRSGADRIAQEWSESVKLDPPARKFPADWARYGKCAGNIRNGVMLEQFKPDRVVAFPGGSGTNDCVKKARVLGIEVLDYR